MLTKRTILNSGLWQSISLVVLMVISIHSSEVYAVVAESDQSVLFHFSADEGSKVAGKTLSRAEKQFAQDTYQNSNPNQNSDQNSDQNTDPDHCLAISHGEVCHSGGGCCPASIVGFTFGKTPPGQNVFQHVLQTSFYKITLPAEIRPPIIVLS